MASASKEVLLSTIRDASSALMLEHGYIFGAWAKGPNSIPEVFGTDEMKSFMQQHEQTFLTYNHPAVQPRGLAPLPDGWEDFKIGFLRSTVSSGVRRFMNPPKYKGTPKPSFWPPQMDWKSVDSGFKVKDLITIIRFMYEYAETHGTNNWSNRPVPDVENSNNDPDEPRATQSQNPEVDPSSHPITPQVSRSPPTPDAVPSSQPVSPEVPRSTPTPEAVPSSQPVRPEIFRSPPTPDAVPSSQPVSPEISRSPQTPDAVPSPRPVTTEVSSSPSTHEGVQSPQPGTQLSKKRKRKLQRRSFVVTPMGARYDQTSEPSTSTQNMVVKKRKTDNSITKKRRSAYLTRSKKI